MVWTAPSPPAVRARSAALDRLRGLAIVLMVGDHCLIVFGGPHWIRDTVTRLSMPLFFVISGHLWRRLQWRQGAIGLVGAVLPVLVPWIDTPNVLLWYAAGCVALACTQRWPATRWLLVALPLVLYANGFFPARSFGTSYQPTALVALMALGSQLPRQVFRHGVALPPRLATVGRYPLTCYVTHLLALCLLVRLGVA